MKQADKINHLKKPSSSDGGEPAVPVAVFRLLFESVPDPCLVLDTCLRIVAVNNVYLLATLTKREEIIGRGIFEVFPDNPAETDATGVRNLSASLNRVLANRAPDTMAIQKYDIRKPEKEGGCFEERYWSPINTPVFGTDNEIAYIIHRVADVTEFVHLKLKGVEEHKVTEELRERAVQMEAEIYAKAQDIAEANLKLKRANGELELQRKKLLESEQRFNSFMFHLPLAAWMKDMLGRYVYINAEGECIFSKPLSELVGKTDEEFLPPDTARLFVENDKRVLAEGGSLQTTEVLCQADGIEHCFVVSKFVVPGSDGQPAYLAGVALDITESKRAEAEIQRLASFPLMNPNPVLELDANGQMIFCNPAAKQILENAGYNNRINPFFPQEMSLILQDLRDKKTGQFFREIEIDDCFFEELIYLAPLFQTVRIYTMDITRRKQAEEEVERLNTDLAVRAAELEAANQELEAFNYTVAHDLRKPLTVINSYTQVIKELCGEKLGEKCMGYLEGAYKGTLRMNQLIDALLNFSRLAHVDPRRETVDLSTMAFEVATELKLVEPERRVTFIIADGVSADGDAALLQVVLDNLLGNAWKYTGTRDEGIIEFSATEVDGKPAYFVRDNGAGFDMADAEKLFTPFQRLPGAEEWRGFGIGLATVERIIRRHGGRVWAEGASGKGATFYFTL